jgi:hypothetical protein
MRRSISEGDYADVESVNSLEIISCDFDEILIHIPALRPFLKSLDSYQLRRQDNLDEESGFVNRLTEPTFVHA